MLDKDIEQLAKNFDLPIYKDLSHFPLVKERKNLIPYLFAKNRSLLPIEKKSDEIIVAICDPKNQSGLDELKLFLKTKITPVFCHKASLEEAIEKCYHQKKDPEIVPDESEEPVKSSDEIEGYDLLEQTSQNSVIRLLNIIFMEAIGSDASDIHFEPLEEGLIVRFRIDGVLQKRFTPPKNIQTQLITRIKVMAKLDIAEHRLPQDGRIKLKMGEREIDFRVSTIPTHFGERVVLRILDKGNVLLGLDMIGMPDLILKSFRKIISMPEGIILVTGPTGSGKTTTLYSSIMELNAEEMNIMTIEDPVEYKLPTIAQIGVNPKIQLTFSAGLRHILRQDPDVIMIGEIRDVETAEIAIQASLTGHLVFSTLHTNDAPSAITRLAEMGIEPYLLSSSIVGVLAQRLVRKICSRCKIKYQPTGEELREIGLQKNTPHLWKGNGCDACYHTGYKGRVAVYEFMPVSQKLKKEMMQSTDANRMRASSDFLSLRENGAKLVECGITTSAEVFRVTRMSEREEF